MKLRIMSDIHLEFERYDNNGKLFKENKDGTYRHFKVPVTDDESETVLILAGDIGVIKSAYTIVPFVEEMSDRFKDVIFVPGNHEYYKSSFINGLDNLKADLMFTGAHVLNNQTIKIDDVNFIGATLWTDYDKGNGLSMMRAKMAMNDYATIRTGTLKEPYLRKLDPMDLATAHLNSRHYIDTELNRLKLAGEPEKTVVVTHHLPSFKSVHEMFHNSDLNGAYHSDLEELMATYSPELWFHGHTHCSCDYEIMQTRVICNPRGYRPSDLNPEFDPCFTVEI